MVAAAIIFPARQIRLIQLRALRWPLVVLVASVALAAYLKNRETLQVGEAVIAAIGSYLWPVRTFRVREPDAPPPGRSAAGSPGTLVPSLSDGIRELRLRAIDTIVSRTGAWIGIAGTLVGTLVPSCLGLVHI